MNNLLDVAPDWVHFNPHVQQSLCTDGFVTMFREGPQKSGTKVWTVEEWDELEEREWCREWVYVADEVRKIAGSCRIEGLGIGGGEDGGSEGSGSDGEGEVEKGVDGVRLVIEGVGRKEERVDTGKATTGNQGLEGLRDAIAPKSAIGWYVVHCGDEMRDDVGEDSSMDEDDEGATDVSGYSETDSTPRESREGTPARSSTASTMVNSASGQRTPSGISSWASGIVGSMRTRRERPRTRSSVSSEADPTP